MSTPNPYIDQEASFKGRYSKEVFESLYFSYRPFLKRLIVYITVGFIGRLLLLSNANLIGYWVDTFCVTSATTLCRPVPTVFAGLGSEGFLILLLSIAVMGFAMTALFRIGFSRLSALAVSQLYDEVTLRTSRLPMRFFDTNPVGRIVTRFSSDYGNVFRLFGGPLAEFFAIVFDLICMVFLVTLASLWYLPVIIVVAIANYAVYRLNRDSLRLERRELSASRSPSIAHFAETTQGASTIRIFGRQMTFMNRFAQLNDRYLNQRLRTQVRLFNFSMQMGSLTALLLLSTGLLGVFLSRHGLVSIGSIGVAFTFIILSGHSIQMFFEWFAQFEEAMTGVERLNDYLRKPMEPGAKLPSSRQFPTHHPVYGVNEEMQMRQRSMTSGRAASLKIEDLNFRYAPELPTVLKDLNIQIKAGEKIGVVGRTGSGKTSLIQALLRLYPLESGRILINDRSAQTDLERNSPDHNELDLALFRQQFALISQEPILFKGTLRENLDLAGAEPDEKLIEALARVGLKEWFLEQPQGLKSPIEERGRNLSSGERQLLCMARCLLQDASIVIMDEATSSVDPQSEEILVRATREFFADRTQIIIAHRLSTLAYCDRILWLDRGELRLFDRPEKVIPVFQAASL